jgi:hypothetical protein
MMGVDPVAALYAVPSPTPYGPIWTLLSMGLVLPLGAGSLGLAVAFKLLSALALLAIASAGRALAAAQSASHGDLAFVALGFNPLLLIEGPLSGHNDLVFAALVLAASLAAGRGRSRLGYLLVGLSAGIKYASLALLPWLVLEATRGGKRRGPSRLLRESLLALAALVPTLLAYAPFWVGRSTLDGLVGAWKLQSAEAPGVVRLGAVGALWLGLTVWVGFGRDGGRHLAAWAVFSTVVALALSPVPFAWYLVWPAAAALARWDRVHGTLAAACMVIAYVLQMAYVLPR